MTSDDLMLGEIVAREEVARMDQFYLLRQLQETAAREERIRLARDLHDGLLQSLAGAIWQLDTVRLLLEQDPRRAQERLLDVQRLLAAQQRDLRFFIGELRQAPFNLPKLGSTPTVLLDELGEQIERQWGLRVDVRIEGLEVRIPGELAHEIYQIVHEALVNAARHSDASVVQVQLRVESQHVDIAVADNGRGFPFRGHYDDATLIARNLGPVTLKERVASLGGSLAIDSTEVGACLHITLPFMRPGA